MPTDKFRPSKRLKKAHHAEGSYVPLRKFARDLAAQNDAAQAALKMAAVRWLSDKRRTA